MDIFLTIQEDKDVRTPDDELKLAEFVSRLTKVAVAVTDEDFEPVLTQVTDAEGVMVAEFEIYAKE